MKKTQLQIKQDQMKMLVEHCAPHLALDLYDLAPLKFSRPLPVTQKMMERGTHKSLEHNRSHTGPHNLVFSSTFRC